MTLLLFVLAYAFVGSVLMGLCVRYLGECNDTEILIGVAFWPFAFIVITGMVVLRFVNLISGRKSK